MQSKKLQARKAKPITIALTGNPNTGKSTLFNALTGLRQHVGNWHGKTVERAEGWLRHNGERLRVVDLPGTYGLSGSSIEEQIAQDYIASGEADVIVDVVDATNLERNLNLALQLLELTPNLVIALNMMDEAKAKGLVIDVGKLSERLGVPVVPIVAKTGEGLQELVQAAVRSDRKAARAQYRKSVESRYELARRLAAEVITCTAPHRRNWTDAVDSVVLNKWIAFPMMLVMFLIIFWITAFGANYPSDWLAKGVDWLVVVSHNAMAAMGAPWWLKGALVDGLITGVGAVFAVMFPPMLIFFVLYALLEDLGWIPRVAFNMDRLMRFFGSQGKHCLTCMVCFGCNVPGVLSSRIFEQADRTRLISIITAPLNPCNGRLGNIVPLCLLLFGFWGAPVLVLLMVLSIAAVLFASWLLTHTIFRGTPMSTFIMELPPYRMPNLKKLLIRTIWEQAAKTQWRALCYAAPACLLIWTMSNLPFGAPFEQSLTGKLVALLDPLGKPMGLNGMMLTACLFCLPAKEIALSSLAITYGLQRSLAESGVIEKFLSMNWSPLSALCFLVFYMLYLPCLVTVRQQWQETRSLKWTLISSVLCLTLASAITAAIYQGARLLGVSG